MKTLNIFFDVVETGLRPKNSVILISISHRDIQQKKEREREKGPVISHHRVTKGLVPCSSRTL